MSGW